MESFLRAFLHPSSSDSATSRGARSEDKGGTEEDMQDDAMVDTDSSSDKEICKVDKHKLTIRKAEGGRTPVMPHQHHGCPVGQACPWRITILVKVSRQETPGHRGSGRVGLFLSTRGEGKPVLP